VPGSLLKAPQHTPLHAARGLRRPGVAWSTLCGLAAAGALWAWWLPANTLDWQPALATAEPWRTLTAAAVHWSPMHLGANLLGTAVLATLGWVARLPVRATLAWMLAWPLTHIALVMQPALAHYGGLSGVLHAGVAVAALWLLLYDRGARRGIGGAVLAGLLLKLLLEQPWGPALRTGGGWDIALAPLAHATGVAAGALCTGAVWLMRPARRAG
jgi:rhomboid family GlyGly-CTERM serine protease